MLEAEIYKALGDPARLEIIQRLASHSTCTVGELSQNLGMSRQAARKQLQVLVNARLVALQPRGRQIDASLNTQTLQIAQRFMARLERQWDTRLQALKQYVEDAD